MEAPKLNNLTIEEYIKIEQETDTKYEYHDGEIFAMAGGNNLWKYLRGIQKCA